MYRYYISVERNGEHLMNGSQLERPTMPELRAWVAATLEIQKFSLKRLSGERDDLTWTVYIDGKATSTLIRVQTRHNNVLHFTQDFGKKCTLTDDDLYAWCERFDEIAPKRALGR